MSTAITKKRVVALISGRGSNLLNLIRKAEAYQIIAIISDKADAPGLMYGTEFNIETKVVERQLFSSLKEQKSAVLEAVKSFNPDYVVLAGFMQIIAPEFVNSYVGKLLNIHPALLPNYPGLHTHAQALAAKAKVHGCTVHFVDTGVDTGAIIAQMSCSVLADDSEESLASRVLELEHQLYPFILNNLAMDQIRFKDGKVLVNNEIVRSGNKIGISFGK